MTRSWRHTVRSTAALFGVAGWLFASPAQADTDALWLSACSDTYESHAALAVAFEAASLLRMGATEADRVATLNAHASYIALAMSGYFNPELVAYPLSQDDLRSKLQADIDRDRRAFVTVAGGPPNPLVPIFFGDGDMLVRVQATTGDDAVDQLLFPQTKCSIYMTGDAPEWLQALVEPSGTERNKSAGMVRESEGRIKQTSLRLAEVDASAYRQVFGADPVVRNILFISQGW